MQVTDHLLLDPKDYEWRPVAPAPITAEVSGLALHRSKPHCRTEAGKGQGQKRQDRQIMVLTDEEDDAVVSCNRPVACFLFTATTFIQAG